MAAGMSFWDSLPRWAKIWLAIAFVLYLTGAMAPVVLILGCYHDLAPFCR